MPTIPSAKTSMKKLQDRIWHLLVKARQHDWENQAVLKVPLPDGELRLHRSGDWQADTCIDDSAVTMLDALGPLAASSRMVIAQLGQSLDGRIATRTGHSHYINGPVALTHLHRLRALVDAVIVGAGTAIADLPRLSVRRVDGPDPVGVVIDPSGRVPVEGPLFRDSRRPSPVLHLIGTDAMTRPAPGHVERIRLERSAGGFAPGEILGVLEERGLTKILIEGGTDTISRFLHADALDRMHLLIAPLIIGSGRNGLELPPIDRLDEARRPRIRSFALDDELLVDVDLRSG